MKTIHNTTQAPLRIPLGGDKILHLGPGQTGTIADDAVQSRGVRRLIESGAVTVSGEEGRTEELSEHGSLPREFSHGHVHGNKVFPSGNRGG
jgi:hypothetical protein